ncbi:hypothetical protein EYF80_036826 [Liparis tanakae]|uniref:Uncharacterized protein n=1 Tax=Liparis tanakae TaxID=230148 RepID=A0A4Z2GID9_9TELE|nr:hypothetical protein EYF80_036826 [Liparis tanakae]
MGRCATAPPAPTGRLHAPLIFPQLGADAASAPRAAATPPRHHAATPRDTFISRSTAAGLLNPQRSRHKHHRRGERRRRASTSHPLKREDEKKM